MQALFGLLHFRPACLVVALATLLALRSVAHADDTAPAPAAALPDVAPAAALPDVAPAAALPDVAPAAALPDVAPAAALPDVAPATALPDVAPTWAGALSVVGSATYIISEFAFKSAIAPEACRWCSRDDAGNDTLNGFDAAVRDALVAAPEHHKLINLLSYGTGVLLPAMTSFGLVALDARREGRPGQAKADALIVTEATVLALNVTQVAKFLLARERPYAHAAHLADPSVTTRGLDDNVSFFSGHSSMAFALATAGGTVATLRGYRHARWVWAVGLTAAAATGVLRIAADKHNASDVLTGAAVGAAIGGGIPLLHRTQRGPKLLVAPAEGGASAALAWQWQ
ncbi:MAG: phosphatase PAP2 family protein [Myxococcales bacterium]|nr:phosphatase PAP2 family protein [Myxococcales bacterium]